MNMDISIRAPEFEFLFFTHFMWTLKYHVTYLKLSFVNYTVKFGYWHFGVMGRNSRDNECKNIVAAAAAKSLQSCLNLCDPIDGSPPGSPVHGIL